MEYLKEPFDFKLFILQMLRKWKFFVVWTLLGALLFGGSYFLVKVVYAPAREYQAKAVYYVEYAHDPGTGQMYTYFNDYTLNSWLTMDAFVDKVRPKLSVAVTKEELDAYVELTIPSDVRVVCLTVTTPVPKLTMELLAAYEEAFQAFGEAQREINRIERQDHSGEAGQIIADIRTGIEKTSGEYVEIINRKDAIAYAIQNGKPGDIIVLAGKGHEDYQEIEGKKYPMDERVLIQEILEGK